MRILMLGWEFPPFISGGLGTACYGLTKALNRRHEITFVLPKPVGTDFHSHVKLLTPQSARAAYGDRSPESVASTFQAAAHSPTNHSPSNHSPSSHATAADAEPAPPSSSPASASHEPHAGEDLEHVTFKAVPSRMLSPYPGASVHAPRGGEQTSPDAPARISFDLHAAPRPAPASEARAKHGQGNGQPASPTDVAPDPAAPPYAGDLIQEARRYASLCVDLADGVDFDVIHAHDWLTFPAGLAVAAHTGKPLVVHVHSTEFDRAGDHIHQQIFEIERRGMMGACRVIAVSHLTRSILQHRYSVPEDKLSVVYNGIENGRPGGDAQPEKIRRGDKVVLFLGRVTMQKGPEYFIGAAKKVLEKFDKVKFVIAGSGDRIEETIELAAREGIGHKVLFTGFLRTADVERVFRMADLYVMPSVSEPFGIAPLEAISHDVPVIISKQSGVAEVLDAASARRHRAEASDLGRGGRGVRAGLRAGRRSRPALSVAPRGSASPASVGGKSPGHPSRHVKPGTAVAGTSARRG